MQEIDLKSWEDFEERLQRLENEYNKQGSSSEFLYRGQGRKSWELLTTLERHMQKCISLKEYYHTILEAKPQIESFTGEKWNILSRERFENWLQEHDSFMEHAFGWSIDFQEIYSYLAYLRHYGFPSPLLDWSSSPYVAAYFAFRDVLQRKECEEDKEYVSIYVYLETPTGLKSGGNEAYIWRLGPYVKTDRRHFIQQSRYTICIIRDNIPDGEWKYAPHGEAFARNDQNQDLLWKFNIPYSERLKVLKQLDKYNINALSLFGSKESLMETMALREIHLKTKEL
jgi:hypothetical protein